MSTVTALALIQQSTTTQPSDFSLKGILANIPHDPASLVALVLCVAVIAWVLWAGHRKPKDEAPEE